MKKRVLIFSLDYLPGTISGAEEALKEVTDRVEDIEWHMITLYYDSNVPRVQKIGNVLVHYVGIFGKPDATLQERKKMPLHLNKHYFQFAAAVKGLMLHRKYKYDAIWGMMAHGTGVPAVLFKWFNPKVPYLLTLQEGDSPEHIERAVRPLWFIWKQCFTKASTIQCISTFLASWAKRRGATCPIKIVRNGANQESITPNFSQDEVNELSKELGKKEGEVWLTNTARLVHQKGFDTTIHSLKFLPDNIKLLVIGGGPCDGSLKDLTATLGLEKRVIFAGQVERDVVSKYRLVGDIFVGPSRSEGLGNAFLSAMASEMPVIATQVGGISDFLFDSELNPEKETTGFAVDVDNPEQIAKKVIYILNNTDEVSKITKRAREMILEEYNWDVASSSIRNIFLDIIEQQS